MMRLENLEEEKRGVLCSNVGCPVFGVRLVAYFA
jgi:hypothetical protein